MIYFLKISAIINPRLFLILLSRGGAVWRREAPWLCHGRLVPSRTKGRGFTSSAWIFWATWGHQSSRNPPDQRTLATRVPVGRMFCHFRSEVATVAQKTGIKDEGGGPISATSHHHFYPQFFIKIPIKNK